MGKHNRFFALILCPLLLLCACSKTDELEDRQKSTGLPADRSQSQLREGFVETEDADYYTLEQESGLCLTYFCPKGENTFQPLCGKPNCDHSGKDCNAATGIAFGAAYGKLFYVGEKSGTVSGLALYEMEPDGSNHKERKTIPTPQGQFSFSFEFYFCGDKLIEICTLSANMPIELQIPHVYVIDLLSMEAKEPFSAYFSTYREINTLRRCGEFLYAAVMTPQEDGTIEAYLTQMDPEAGTVRELFPIELQYNAYAELAPETHSYLGIWYVEGDTVFYFMPDEGFFEYSLTDRSSKLICHPTPDGRFAVYDEDYIYMIGKPRDSFQSATLYVLDRSYELLGQVELTDGETYNFNSTTCIYFSRHTGKLDARLRKDDIANGVFALEPLS